MKRLTNASHKEVYFLREVTAMRLIDADTICEGMVEGWQTVLIKAQVDNAPTVDAVVVTRCKGCKHSWEDIGGLCCGYGPLVDSIVPEDFFCAYGKPKEG